MTFEAACAEYGWLPLKLEDLSDAERSLHQELMERFVGYAQAHAAERRPGFELPINFIDDPEFNAFAYSFEGQVGIVISWTCVLTLIADFDELFSSNELSWVGTAEVRAMCAEWCFYAAAFYIFLHEMGHCWNGHMGLSEANGIRLFSERGITANGSVGNIDILTMEMDADGFACAGIANLSNQFGFQFPARDLELEERFGEGSTPFYMAAFALHYLWQKFDEAADFDPNNERTHPSMPFRHHIIDGTLASAMIDRIGRLTSQEAYGAAHKGTWDAVVIYAKLKGIEPRLDDYKQVFEEGAGLEYQKRLLRHWHVLHPHLDRHKLGGVLPPVQTWMDD